MHVHDSFMHVYHTPFQVVAPQHHVSKQQEDGEDNLHCNLIATSSMS